MIAVVVLLVRIAGTYAVSTGSDVISSTESEQDSLFDDLTSDSGSTGGSSGGVGSNSSNSVESVDGGIVGVVSFNDGVSGATVRGLDSGGDVVSTTTTDEEGKYLFDGGDVDSISAVVVIVDGVSGHDDYPVYASYEQDSVSVGSVVDFSFVNPSVGNVDGDVVTVSYQIDEDVSSVNHVGTIEQLQAIDSVNGEYGAYKLVSDIDASETGSWYDGKGFHPIGHDWDYAFSGSFDGEGHVITDLTVNRDDYASLFGWLNDAEIKRVGLENVDIDGGDYGTYVGGLYGWSETESTIGESYVTGEVDGDDNVGGLGGGGSATIVDSYADTQIYSQGDSAGLAKGSNNVERSYATGYVYGWDSRDGLLGYSNSVEDSYWDSGGASSSSGGGEELTYEEMTGTDNELDGFDSSVWVFEEGEYPKLQGFE